MSKELIRIAKKVAKQEDLIYAPDEDALAWMKTFAKIIKVREREYCAQMCEAWDLPLLAAAIRERKDDDG
jgi:hypothetical protein